MFFVVTRHDKPGSLQLRLAERPGHLAYLETVLGRIIYGGALLDSGGKQNGSVLIIDVPDLEAAQDFAQSDPYVEVGLFAETRVEAFRPVFRDGERIR